jgi:RNA polymerase sigma factor (sigma-70 family)
MSSDGSVTHWIHQLQGGGADAARKLWERYCRRLVGLARKRLQGARRGPANEDDVAQSVFASFFRGVEQGRFPDLQDRNNLWRLLAIITARKAIDVVKKEGRPKHGGGKLRGESALQGPTDSGRGGIEAVIGDESTPEFEAEMDEEFRRLLDKLDDDELRSIAVWKMEGFTNEELAAKLLCAVSTVERRLRMIRKIWQDERHS